LDPITEQNQLVFSHRISDDLLFTPLCCSVAVIPLPYFLIPDQTCIMMLSLIQHVVGFSSLSITLNNKQLLVEHQATIIVIIVKGSLARSRGWAFTSRTCHLWRACSNNLFVHRPSYQHFFLEQMKVIY
jgi:hypothetical protein